MISLITFFLLIASFICLVLFVLKKIPALAELPDGQNPVSAFINKTKDKIKGNDFVKSFSFDLMLHKTLSKLRISALKTETKIGEWLGNLRQKNIQKKNSFSDNYWEKLKEKK